MNQRTPAGPALAPVLFAAWLLSGCQGLPAGAPEAGERLQSGDRIAVQRTLTIPAGDASVTLQDGQITQGMVDRFTASCRFVMDRNKPQAQQVRPGEFIVTAVRYWEDFVALDFGALFRGGELATYETTLRLHSADQPEVYSLVCRHEDEQMDGRHLRSSEIQQALGDYAQLMCAPLD